MKVTSVELNRVPKSVSRFCAVDISTTSFEVDEKGIEAVDVSCRLRTKITPLFLITYNQRFWRDLEVAFSKELSNVVTTFYQLNFSKKRFEHSILNMA